MTRNDWSIVKNIFNPAPRLGISNIEVPDKDATGNVTDIPYKVVTWKRITDPLDVENNLLERIIKHFEKAEGTLFTSPEIRNCKVYLTPLRLLPRKIHSFDPIILMFASIFQKDVI